MKTLKDLKLAVAAASALTLLESSRPHKYMGVRRAVVQTNSVGFSLLSNGEPSYMNWPARNELSFPAPNQFRIQTDYGLSLVYEIHPKE